MKIKYLFIFFVCSNVYTNTNDYAILQAKTIALYTTALTLMNIDEENNTQLFDLNTYLNQVEVHRIACEKIGAEYFIEPLKPYIASIIYARDQMELEQ